MFFNCFLQMFLCANSFRTLFFKNSDYPLLFWKLNFAKNFVSFRGCDLQFGVAGCESCNAKTIIFTQFTTSVRTTNTKQALARSLFGFVVVHEFQHPARS